MKLIHIAKITENGTSQFLFLRKEGEQKYRWFIENEQTEVFAETIEEAIRLGVREWKQKGFNTIQCGFRYTLPERDEHGINALFHQMVASLSTSNGIYFDEELGSNCFVQNYSLEARDLFFTFRKNGVL